MSTLKYFLYIIVLFFTLTAKSAPSDCVQLAEDGAVNCTPASTYFIYSQSGPKFNTAEDLISYIVNNIICSAYVGPYECYAQYENQPIYPPPGRPKCSSVPTCGKFINYSPNQTQNAFSVVTTILNNSDPYYLTSHSQRSIQGFRIMSCPSNTTAVSQGGGDIPFTMWCKPISITFEPPPCNDGCNPGNGSSSY